MRWCLLIFIIHFLIKFWMTYLSKYLREYLGSMSISCILIILLYMFPLFRLHRVQIKILVNISTDNTTRRDRYGSSRRRRKFIEIQPSSIAAVTWWLFPILFPFLDPLEQRILGHDCGERRTFAPGLLQSKSFNHLFTVIHVAAINSVAKFWAYGSGFDSVDEDDLAPVWSGFAGRGVWAARGGKYNGCCIFWTPEPGEKRGEFTIYGVKF